MSKIKTSKNFGKDDWNTNTVAVQFANGVNGIIAYNPDCRQNQFSNDVITIGETGIGTNCLAILYDVDGFKNPNNRGDDLRDIGNIALDGSNCAIELSDGTCFTAPFYPTAVTKAECEQMMADGYPITRGCDRDDDYWAGAVKACHDLGSSLPGQEQLTQLARDLYPGAEISSSLNKFSHGTRDNDLAVSMGFISSPSSSFIVWSSVDYSSRGADVRNFNSTSTGWTNDGRYDSDAQAVCLAE